MYLNRFVRSSRDNGSYVFATQLAGAVCNPIRNFLLSRKLGVKKIKIGSHSYLRGLSFIEMGEDFWAGNGLWLEAVVQHEDQRFSPKIRIGNKVRVSQYVHIAATNLVTIGDNVLIGSKVMITDHNHGQYSKRHSSPLCPPALRQLDHDRSVVIGKNTWLADGVVVTPGSNIGEGCIIGANSVVTGSIPPYAMALGIPARIQKVFDFNSEEWKPSNES